MLDYGMMINAANLEFDRTNNKSIAKTMFNYFLSQYAEATRRQVIGESELKAMHIANAEFNKNSEFGGGFSRDPYSSDHIRNKEEMNKLITEEVQDAHAIMIFLRDRLLEGMVD